MVTVTSESRATLRTSMGNLVLEFISDKAPRTCENFVTLAKKGFYDGTKFHRIIKDFIVQGGCPHGNGKGGPGFTIRPEFNDTPHVPGVVSMARDTDPHSAGSQFFICAGEARYLDSRYTAFARVVEGLDVLDKLASVPTDIQPKYKEKSVPRDPVYLNGIELDGVEFESEETGGSQGDSAAESPQPEATGEGGADRQSQGGSGSTNEGSNSGSRRNRRGRGRRGKGGGDRSGAAPEQGAESGGRAPAERSDESAKGREDPQPQGEAGGGAPKTPSKGGAASESKAAASDDKPAAKKATRKKATRKKPAGDAAAERSKDED